MAYHPWAVARAFMDIAELLLDQRADPVMMVVPATIAGEILAPHDLGLMRAALVALMGDPVVR